MRDIKKWSYFAIITLLWWGVMYPEFSITGDNCRLTDENGVVYECDGSDCALAETVMNAEAEQVVIKSRFLELLKEWSRGVQDEECTD